LSKHFGINTIPCYYWLLCLLRLIKPDSLNRCFIQWEQTFISGGASGATISFDGKTVRSTGKTDGYESPLHIISAQLAELGITPAQRAVEGKSNEMPAMRELLGFLDIKGCMIAADAPHC
jgi:hypothetical protein